MPLHLEQQLQSFETNVTNGGSDLDSLSSLRDSIIETDVYNAKVANVNAMVELLQLVQYIQRVDDALLGRSWDGLWKSAESIMEEENPQIQQLMDDIEPPFAEAAEVADRASKHVMELAVEVSNFYNTEFSGLEQQLAETSAELQRISRRNASAVGIVRAEQAFLKGRLKSAQERKQDLELRKFKAERDGIDALEWSGVCAGLVFMLRSKIMDLPALDSHTIITSLAMGIPAVFQGTKALYKLCETAILRAKMVYVERSERDLQYQLNGVMERATELERDCLKYGEMKRLFGELKAKTEHMRQTVQILETSLAEARNGTISRLVRVRGVWTQVNALPYVDTRERIIGILDHIVHEMPGGFVSRRQDQSWLVNFIEKVHEYMTFLSNWWSEEIDDSIPGKMDEFEEHRKLAKGLERIRACTPKVLRIQDQVAQIQRQRQDNGAKTGVFGSVLSLKLYRIFGLSENPWVRFGIIGGGGLLLAASRVKPL